MKDVMLEQIIARLRKSILQKEEINNKDLKKQMEVISLKQKLRQEQEQQYLRERRNRL